jgi:hypothetical protein
LEAFGALERLSNGGTKSDEGVRFGEFDRHLVEPVDYYSWGGNDDRPAKTGKGLTVRGAGADGKAGDDDRKGGGATARATLSAQACCSASTAIHPISHSAPSSEGGLTGLALAHPMPLRATP